MSLEAHLLSPWWLSWSQDGTTREQADASPGSLANTTTAGQDAVTWLVGARDSHPGMHPASQTKSSPVQGPSCWNWNFHAVLVWTMWHALTNPVFRLQTNGVRP